MTNRIKNKIKRKFTKIIKEKVIIPCLEGHYLDGRNAFITGGSSGIGFAIADSFLKNGATVIITGRNINKLESAKATLVSKNNVSEDKVKIYVFDLSDVANIENNIVSILNDSKIAVDIFVNNAGVNCGNLFPDTSISDYEIVLDTNLKGMYFVSQAIVKYMVENNIKGNILNISSSSALRPAISPYILSKWGENGLTLGMAKKYLKYGIVVNALAPGSTLTPMLKSTEENNLYLDYAPSKRYLAPEEVGNMATILVSDLGKMIIGDTIYMTGGSGIITFDDMNY